MQLDQETPSGNAASRTGVAAARRAAGDAVGTYRISNVIISLYFFLSPCQNSGMEQLDQQNHSTGAGSENFLTVLQRDALKMGLLRCLSLRIKDPGPSADA